MGSDNETLCRTVTSGGRGDAACYRQGISPRLVSERTPAQGAHPVDTQQCARHRSPGQRTLVELHPPTSSAEVLSRSALHVAVYENAVLADIVKVRRGRTELGWVLIPRLASGSERQNWDRGAQWEEGPLQARPQATEQQD